MMQFVYILATAYICLMGIVVVNAENDDNVIGLNEFYDAWNAIVEGQGGDEDCESNVAHFMDFLDDSLLYCLHKIDGDIICMDYDEYEKEVKLICGIYKEFDVLFDLNEINKNELSLTVQHLLTLDDDCQV